MEVSIPGDYAKLFTSERAFAYLATLNADGSPQVTPVWIDYDGAHLVVNSAKGRRKDRNMRARPRVAVALSDPDNPYRYIEVRGRVVAVTEQGADQHIDKLAKRYLGVDRYPYRQPGEVRVIYRILPEHVSTFAAG